MKYLVIYYSRSGENYVNGQITTINKGNTEYVADFIKKHFDADVFKVETVKAYSKNYMDCIREAQQELDYDERPQLQAYLNDISQYDNIIIAGPCWWGTYPMAIFSAIENLNFKNKTIMPIMTHEGSGMGHCENDLKKLIPDAQFVRGLAIRGANAKNSEKTVIKWIKDNS